MAISLPAWYAVSMAAIAAALLMWWLRSLGSTIIITRLYFWLLKRLVYPMLIRRWYWTGGTRCEALIVICYVIINGFCMGFVARDNGNFLTNLSRRSGTMASINLIPLFLGGRTSILAEILSLSLRSYYLAHHWSGRVVVLQGLLHTGLALSLSRTEFPMTGPFKALGISAASALGLIFVLSLYLIRRLMYEVFLKVHFLLALLVLFSLIFHSVSRGWGRALFPVVAAGIWTINCFFRIAFMIYYNTGNRPSFQTAQANINHFYDAQDKRVVRGMRMDVELKRSMEIRPGRYLYLFLSGMGVGRQFQAHPFVITWWDDSLNARKLSFLIQPLNGITRELVTRNSIQNLIFDGPYGKDHHLENYETVILVASGVGIAGILPYIRSMTYRRVNEGRDLEAYRRGLLTRKIDVFWVLDNNCQEDWIADWMLDLQKRDREELILSFTCFYPNQKSKPTPVASDDFWTFIYKQPAIPIINGIMTKQIQRSAGRTKVVVCGNHDFTTSVRNIVLDTMNTYQNVEFVEADYRPFDNPQRNPAIRPMTWNNIETESTVNGQELQSLKLARSGPVSRLKTIEEASNEDASFDRWEIV